MSNAWLEIACDVPADLSDILAEFLAEISGSGVCIENLNVDAFSPTEIIHSPIMTVRAYFDSADDIEARVTQISSFLSSLTDLHPGLVFATPRVSKVRTEDWSNSWKSNFKPLR